MFYNLQKLLEVWFTETRLFIIFYFYWDQSVNFLFFCFQALTKFKMIRWNSMLHTLNFPILIVFFYRPSWLSCINPYFCHEIDKIRVVQLPNNNCHSLYYLGIVTVVQSLKIIERTGLHSVCLYKFGWNGTRNIRVRWVSCMKLVRTSIVSPRCFMFGFCLWYTEFKSFLFKGTCIFIYFSVFSWRYFKFTHNIYKFLLGKILEICLLSELLPLLLCTNLNHG